MKKILIRLYSSNYQQPHQIVKEWSFAFLIKFNMNEMEAVLGLLKALCGEVAELRMALEEKTAKRKNYTFDEAREYLRISRTTMHERMRRGEFPWAVKRGKSWLFPFDKLKKYAGNQI